MSTVDATVESSAEPSGETAVVLRIVNTSRAPVSVPNPDLGRPAEGSGWEWSVDAYRASLLMSFGMLRVTVRDADGEEVDKALVSTWSTPVRWPDLVLEPGAGLDLVIPLGPLFELKAGERYRVTAAYGEARGEGVVEA